MSLFGVSNKTDNISPTGTFARVCLCRHKTSSNFFALKILSLHDVIRLKQVDHVKNEKNILKVPNIISPTSGATLHMVTFTARADATPGLCPKHPD